MENLDVNVKNWKSLIKPAKLEVQLSDDKSFAKIIAGIAQQIPGPETTIKTAPIAERTTARVAFV